MAPPYPDCDPIQQEASVVQQLGQITSGREIFPTMFQNFGKVLRRCYVDVQIQSYLLYAVTIFGEDVETLFGL